MHCKYCDKEISVDSKFCRFCGGTISTEHKKSVSENLTIKNQKHDEYPDFLTRLAAYFIDFLAMILVAICLVILLGLFFEWETVDGLSDYITGYFSYLIYNTVSLGIWSTTFGKYLFGLKVVRNNNDDLDFGIAFKRSLLQPLSTLFFGIGYWKMDKNDRKQAWHDKVAKTVVIKRGKEHFLARVLTVVAAIIWLYLITIGQ